MMKKLLVVCSLFFSVLSFAQTKVEVPTIVFKVALDETVVKENISITFSEILEDSRCPSDVTCLWGGRAKVKVVVVINGDKTEDRVVLFERGKHTLLAKTETSMFEAIKLSPYPTTATQGKMDYELLIAESTISEED